MAQSGGRAWKLEPLELKLVWGEVQVPPLDGLSETSAQFEAGDQYNQMAVALAKAAALKGEGEVCGRWLCREL